VTDMKAMFWNATSFNQPLNTSGNKWNVSNVTNMESMFGHASSFNQPLNHWNVSNVMNMRGMFNNSTTSFNQPLHAPWYHGCQNRNDRLDFFLVW